MREKTGVNRKPRAFLNHTEQNTSGKKTLSANGEYELVEEPGSVVITAEGDGTQDPPPGIPPIQDAERKPGNIFLSTRLALQTKLLATSAAEVRRREIGQI